MLKINKKGKIIHWLNFALLVIVVYVLISQSGPELQVKGSWHTSLIKNNYLEAQKDLLQQDIKAKKIGRYSVKRLASNGGFFPNSGSPCGKTENTFQLWNKLDKECFPDYRRNVEILSEEILKDKLSDRRFTNIKYNGNLFTAKGEIRNIDFEKNRYFYDTSFAVDVGYNIEEYQELIEKSKEKLLSCRNKRDLFDCLKNPVLWHYGSCDNQQQPDESNRVVKYCVESISTRNPLNYYFALDFTPTKPFEIEDLNVNKNNNVYEISFKYDPLATSYNIYFTNSLDLISYNGKSEDIYVIEQAGEFLNKLSFNSQEIINEPNLCNNKEKNKAYLCDDNIFYILENPLLIQNEDYLFTATTKSNNQESNIDGFYLTEN